MLYYTKNLYTITSKLPYRRKWYENTGGFLIGFESFALCECGLEHRYTCDKYDNIREQKRAHNTNQTHETMDTHNPETPPHQELSEIIRMTRISPEACLNNFSFVIWISTKCIHLSISDILTHKSDYPQYGTNNKLRCDFTGHRKKWEGDDADK